MSQLHVICYMLMDAGNLPLQLGFAMVITIALISGCILCHGQDYISETLALVFDE